MAKTLKVGGRGGGLNKEPKVSNSEIKMKRVYFHSTQYISELYKENGKFLEANCNIFIIPK